MSPEFLSSRAVTIKFFPEIELMSFKHLRAFKKKRRKETRFIHDHIVQLELGPPSYKSI